jgi:hypothetical protein
MFYKSYKTLDQGYFVNITLHFLLVLLLLLLLLLLLRIWNQ